LSVAVERVVEVGRSTEVQVVPICIRTGLCVGKQKEWDSGLDATVVTGRGN